MAPDGIFTHCLLPEVWLTDLGCGLLYITTIFVDFVNNIILLLLISWIAFVISSKFIEKKKLKCQIWRIDPERFIKSRDITDHNKITY